MARDLFGGGPDPVPPAPARRALPAARPRRDMFAPPEPPPPPPAMIPPAAPVPPRLALANRRWLLNHPWTAPEVRPGMLALHVCPVAVMAGRLLAVWQIEQYRRDPWSRRMLALVHAAPAMRYPGLWRWLPAGELVETGIVAPLATPAQLADSTGAGELVAASEARRTAEPAVSDPWLAEWWDRLAAAAGQDHPDDPVLAAMRNKGLVYDSADMEAWPAAMTGMLERLGAGREALRMLFAESGFGSEAINGLLHMRA